MLSGILCRSDKIRQRIGKQDSENRQHRSDDQRQRKTGHGDLIRFFFLSRSQQPGQAVAGTMTAEKTERLNDCHHREDQSHSRSGFRGDLPDKIGVCRVVDSRDQHADDGGDCQFPNQFRNRRLRQ